MCGDCLELKVWYKTEEVAIFMFEHDHACMVDRTYTDRKQGVHLCLQHPLRREFPFFSSCFERTNELPLYDIGGSL